MEYESLGLSNSFCEIMNCSYIFPDVGLALITDKGLSLRRAWPTACVMTEEVLSYLVQN